MSKQEFILCNKCLQLEISEMKITSRYLLKFSVRPFSAHKQDSNSDLCSMRQASWPIVQIKCNIKAFLNIFFDIYSFRSYVTPHSDSAVWGKPLGAAVGMSHQSKSKPPPSKQGFRQSRKVILCKLCSVWFSHSRQNIFPRNLVLNNHLMQLARCRNFLFRLNQQYLLNKSM